MTDLRELVQDLRAHAHEAPAVARGLMRRAANELERRARLVVIGDIASFPPPPEQPDAQS